MLAESEVKLPFKRLGVPSSFPARTGSQEYMLEQFGLTAPQIAEAVHRLVASTALKPARA
jgi:transketolase C-terminal domain/subunit